MILKVKYLFDVLGPILHADSENRIHFSQSGQVFEIKHFLEMLISSCIGRQVIHLVISPTENLTAIYMTAMQLIHYLRRFTDYLQTITGSTLHEVNKSQKIVQHYMLGSIQG